MFYPTPCASPISFLPRDLGLGQDNAIIPTVGRYGDDVVNKTNFFVELFGK